MDAGNRSLSVQVVSDIVCPWCYIGKRQLEAAVANWRARHGAQARVSIVWRPFELNPDLPAAGVARADYLQRKFGSRDPASIYTRVIDAAKLEGLGLAIEQIRHQPNSRAAHALIDAATQAGVQDALVEALFQAYFIDGENLSDTGVLRRIAADAGLADPDIDRALDDPQATARIEALEASARALGVQGVPFFIIDERLAVSGAAGRETLEAAFEQAATMAPAS